MTRTRRDFCSSVLAVGATPLFGACLRPPEGSTIATKATPRASSAARDLPPLAADETRAFAHTSTELFAKLRLGWNLGNSLDVPDGETSWGNPKATPELLRAVAGHGFRLVRIPVTWSAHTGAGPDFALEKTWLTRVERVVRDARAAGLYAVINVHHDGADNFKGVEWLTLNDADGKTTDAKNAAVKARFVAIWRQMAAHFADFGEELLFESMNEIHDGYGAPDPRHFTFINELNQAFVDLVRESGGQNAERHLIVPGYNTNIDHTVAGFQAPKDPTTGRLSLSVHYYDPYTFALVAKTHTWGKGAEGRDDWGQEEHVVSQLDKLKRFQDQGIPVFMGEYGACHQDGFEDYRRYWMEYVTKAAVTRGMLPVFWDNGAKGSGGESFGLLDRATGDALHPRILEAMFRAADPQTKLADVAPARA